MGGRKYTPEGREQPPYDGFYGFAYRAVLRCVTFRAVQIFITFILSTVAQAGDLTISYFKRLDKIKDTGKILPGHGGVFDRIDGLMFISILSYLLYFIVT